MVEAANRPQEVPVQLPHIEMPEFSHQILRTPTRVALPTEDSPFHSMGGAWGILRAKRSPPLSVLDSESEREDQSGQLSGVSTWAKYLDADRNGIVARLTIEYAPEGWPTAIAQLAVTMVHRLCAPLYHQGYLSKENVCAANTVDKMQRLTVE